MARVRVLSETQRLPGRTVTLAAQGSRSAAAAVWYWRRAGVAGTLAHGIPWTSPCGPGRNLLAVPPLQQWRAGIADRLAPFWPRRPSLCARARMGGGALGASVDRPFRLHGLRFGACHGAEMRPGRGARPRARRELRRGGRACRHDGAGAAPRRAPDSPSVSPKSSPIRAAPTPPTCHRLRRSPPMTKR